MISAVASGLLFGLSIIVAVGPQNAYVIRQGIRREQVALIVGVYTLSDVALIVAAVAGAGALLDGRLWLVRVVGIVGICFLLGYAALAARRAWRGQSMDDGDDGDGGDDGATTGPRAALLAALAFTWLNPAVYLDTVFVVGPVAQSHGEQRWWFGLGAIVASAAWFALIGFGARAVAPMFARPAAWRVLDASVAVIMVATATRIAVGL